MVESEELAQRAQELDQLSHRRTSVASSSDGSAPHPAPRERLVSVEIDGRRHEIRLRPDERIREYECIESNEDIARFERLLQQGELPTQKAP